MLHKELCHLRRGALPQSIGEKKKSRDIIGMAVNAATNIRQDDLRDEVFNELDVVMRVMQEGRV